MQMKRDTLKSLKRLQPMGLDRTSLQLRLTVGITTIALLGVGVIGSWTTWQMRQMLVVDHQQKVGKIAKHLYHQLDDVDTAKWQTAINKWAAPDLWIAVKQADGKTLAQSGTLANFSEDLASLSWAQIPIQPTVQTLDGHHLILCRQPLKQAGQAMGELYLARDITHDYRVFSTLINTLRFAMLLALALIAALIAMYIRRSLGPLRRMNQLAAVQAGKPRVVMLPAQPIPTEVQGLVYAMSSLSDRLSQTGERQREFTNSLSHELRTSLCLIQGYLQSTLRRGENLTMAQREALEVAASETDRTIQLLKDLLDLGRINSGTMELHLKPVDLKHLIESMVEMVDPYQERTIEVEATGPVIAQADISQLNRVLMHLLKNAMQFSKPDQPIQMKLWQTESWAMLQISDCGCGIPEADQSRIFEPFYRVEASRCRATGGMGLGLAIVKSLVSEMGGDVTVESALGTGSTFTVKLPIYDAASHKNSEN